MISLRNLLLSIKNPQTKYRLKKHFEQYDKDCEKLGLYFYCKNFYVKNIY